MRQKRLVIGCVLIVLLIALGLPPLLINREWQHQKRNRALIAAIRRNDERAVVSLLNAGADANARDDHKPPTPGRILAQYWERLRGKRPAPNPSVHPALLVAVWDYD